MLSSVAQIVQPVHAGPFGMRSCRIENPHHCVNGDWDITARFCEVIRKNSRTAFGTQDSPARCKLISTVIAGAAIVFPEIIARFV
jgi:hypothetical protein